jgi:hypothetical protein
VFWPKTADPADVARGRAMELRNRLWHQRARVVVAPLGLLAVLLALTRPRAFAFVLLPLASYVASHALTLFAGRYRITSDPLILVCVGALLVDLIWDTRETGRGLNRWAKLTLVVLAVSGSVLAYWRGWDKSWYALPPGPVPQPVFDAAQPNLVTLDLQRSDAVKAVSSGGGRTQLVSAPDGLRVHLEAKPDANSPAGGLRLPVAGLRTARLGLTCDHPDQITTLIVRGLDAEGQTRLSWTWKVTSHCPLPTRDNATSFVLLPGQSSACFVASAKDPDTGKTLSKSELARAARLGDLIRELRVVALLKPGADVNLFLHELTLALPSAAATQSRQRWKALDWPAADERKVLATKSCSVEPVFRAEGLELHLRGTPETAGVQYGGVALPTLGLGALRLRMSFDHPENIDALIVSGVDADGEQRLRWEHPFGHVALRPVPGNVQDWVLVPGESSDGFVTKVDDSGATVSQLRVIVRIRPGTELSATLHTIEIAPEKTPTGAKAPATASADDKLEAPLGD